MSKKKKTGKERVNSISLDDNLYKAVKHLAVEESKSLKDKALVWYGQISKGIMEMLKLAKIGVINLKKPEIRDKYRQLQLSI